MLSDLCFELTEEESSGSFDITEGSTIAMELRRNSITHITEHVGNVQYILLSVARFYLCPVESSLYSTFTYSLRYH
jgi:hypothetical protein